MTFWQKLWKSRNGPPPDWRLSQPFPIRRTIRVAPSPLAPRPVVPDRGGFDGRWVRSAPSARPRRLARRPRAHITPSAADRCRRPRRRRSGGHRTGAGSSRAAVGGCPPGRRREDRRGNPPWLRKVTAADAGKSARPLTPAEGAEDPPIRPARSPPPRPLPARPARRTVLGRADENTRRIAPAGV